MSLKQELIDAGYKEHRSEVYDTLKGTQYLFQKRVKDGHGIRYHIDCWYYEKDFILFQEDTVMFEVQFTMEDGEKCNVTPFYKDITQAEELIATMWDLMQFSYYEWYH